MSTDFGNPRSIKYHNLIGMANCGQNINGREKEAKEAFQQVDYKLVQF